MSRRFRDRSMIEVHSASSLTFESRRKDGREVPQLDRDVCGTKNAEAKCATLMLASHRSSAKMVISTCLCAKRLIIAAAEHSETTRA